MLPWLPNPGCEGAAPDTALETFSQQCHPVSIAGVYQILIVNARHASMSCSPRVSPNAGSVNQRRRVLKGLIRASSFWFYQLGMN